MKFQIVKKYQDLKGDFLYSRRDYYLIFRNLESERKKEPFVGIQDTIDKQLNIPKAEYVYLHFDTLTLTFLLKNMALFSMDAYLNIDQAENIKIDLSVFTESKKGTLIIKKVPEDEHFSMGIYPLFQFSIQQLAMKIILGKTGSEKYFRLGDNIVVGLFKEALSEIMIKNVIID